MFFFMPEDHARFTFTRKSAKKIEGIDTWEIEFRETKRPTLIRTRAGKDVPIEGTLHVKPDDGTVVRTRFKMRNFADVEAAPEQQAPAQRAARQPGVEQRRPRGDQRAACRCRRFASTRWKAKPTSR